MIVGRLTAARAATLRICGTSLSGPLTVGGSTGLVLVGGDAATGQCDPTTIVSPVRVIGNSGGVELNGNTIVGPLEDHGQQQRRAGARQRQVHAEANAVTGPSTIQQ